jgi:hypothetical protein
MRALFIEEDEAYDGRAIDSHWAFKAHGVQGDSIIAFIGPCDVKLPEMVDLADVKANAPIWSSRMAHFIIEHFDRDLEKAVWRQRLLVASVMEGIHRRLGRVALERRGNDLYDGARKLNVSIAALTPVSTKIHVGINVLSQGTPVPTVGLEDYQIGAAAFTRELMEGYAREFEDVQLDRCKVRPTR